MKALLLAVVCVVLAPLTGLGNAEAAEGRASKLLVGFKPGTSAAARQKALRDLGLVEKEAVDLSSIFLEVAEARPGLFRAASLQQAKDSPDVAIVEEDVYVANWLLEAPSSMPRAFWPTMDEVRAQIRFKADPEPVTGVPVPVASMTDASGNTNEIPWGVRRVHAPAVWRRGDGRSQGSGVRVAVLDTGIDCSHPDLQCDVSAGYNAIDSSLTANDDGWHGTDVAAIIGAKWHEQGMVGVAPQAQLIPVKVLEKGGGSSVSSIIKGIVWAANHDVKIMNMSFGAPVSSSLMHVAIMYAKAKGVTIIAAAGNRGPKPDTVTYPGAYSEVISVAASGQRRDGSDDVPMFSSRGPQVRFIAPGANIYSCIPGGGYAYHSGTSMAAPHLSGLAAIAVAYGADGPQGVQSALEKAARPIAAASRQEQGAGMVEAERLVPYPVVAYN